MRYVLLALAVALVAPSAAQKNDQLDMELYVQDIDTGFLLLVDNGEYVPITIDVTLETTNVNSPRGNKFTVVAPPRVVGHLVDTLFVINPYERSSVAAGTHSSFGDFTATGYDTNYVYQLPFAEGSAHRVFQGYNGKYSHRGEMALDLDLALGTPVYAARSGRVVDVVESNDQNCNEPRCMDYNNYVSVAHGDNSYANYAHLKYGGVTVEEGDYVTAGDLIAYSGNTGYSSGPHLHFVVFVAGIGDWKSVPTVFATGNGERVERLSEGKTYRRSYGLLPQNQ